MTGTPHTIITNGLVRAVVQLPDAAKGFYRATRFEWAGIISSLTACGHEFVGQWRETHDPLRHDSITGLAEEFQSFPDSDIDYASAEPGGEFLRLGVGLLRRPLTSDPAHDSFQRFNTYEIVQPGVWQYVCEDSAVHFRQTARSPSGVAIVYEKSILLPDGASTVVIQHRLTNSGTRPIHTHHYNHNFFRIDAQPTAGDFVLQLPFTVASAAADSPLLQLDPCTAPDYQTELSLTRPLQDGESVLTDLLKPGSNVLPYDMLLHDRNTGATVRIRGDQPLSRLLFWATWRTFCPEPYVRVDVPCGESVNWTLQYDLSVVPPDIRIQHQKLRLA